ncbi:MAG: hypothetical protein OXB91_04365 [Bryobacterales bacterium]|nr:hypothetical protein [Bryobacterales bacterium]
MVAGYENHGQGGFARRVIHSDQAAHDTRPVDMEVDGDLDVLVAGQKSQDVVWCENPVNQ